MKTVTVKFFASARELAGGAPEMVVPIGPEIATVQDLMELLIRQLPALGSQRYRLLAARNHRYATPATPVEPGDEIAFFPPVSGG